MTKLRAVTIAFVFTVLLAAGLNQRAHEATRAHPARSNAKNRFLGHWSSHLTRPSGERVYDGVFEITDVDLASADEVSILHSVRGGPFTGYTLTAPDRIEGRYFITQEKQHHSVKRSAPTRLSGTFAEEEGTWVGTQP
jgi:hypothetical protein